MHEGHARGKVRHQHRDADQANIAATTEKSRRPFTPPSGPCMLRHFAHGDLAALALAIHPGWGLTGASTAEGAPELGR
jgi:hypothetical protein